MDALRKDKSTTIINMCEGDIDYNDEIVITDPKRRRRFDEDNNGLGNIQDVEMGLQEEVRSKNLTKVGSAQQACLEK